MEQFHYSSQRREEAEAEEFSLREWPVKARIKCESTSSRRFSGSYIRSFREDGRSFRSNITISSTASSPGYSMREEIDPSTYSFTAALKALQARSSYNSWESLSPDGFSLNSKWYEAEKYICNPLSGEVPMECLSAKTLSARSFRNFRTRITMSAPLVYSTNSRLLHERPITSPQEEAVHQYPIPEKKVEGMTKDVGTQSTPPDRSSASPSPASTPPIKERSLKACGKEETASPNSNSKPKNKSEDARVAIKAGKEKEMTKGEKGDRNNTNEQTWRQGEGGCLSWMRTRQRDKHKTRKKNFLPHLKGC
ncbi:uncharacterized protein LOC111006452 isoform X2 [Momordica charantia]|uniref:Uncharacterized protein LOC111006452 isoform X2 n=1 Tax=Momordica charantia TaxID=3673 RepID=A0A6J1C127_MOMCH|nr:uncharacterized protein LOC111006452 isoform X2 [Momordica charantia]